jgi:hypothetical protein
MAVFRLILLVTVLGGLMLLLVQNWSPVLSLVFLGMKSKPIPLAIWILFSTAAGAFTTIFVTSLLNLSNSFAGQQRRATPSRSSTTSTRATSQTRREEPAPRPSPPPSEPQTESRRTRDEPDDWETDSSTDDWDFEKEEAPTSSPENTQVRDSNIYERQQEPKSSSKSDSAYSYSYREPKNSGVGKTESVYDADYRVIIPPYQPPTTDKAEDDDWGFLDEDEDEDEDKRPRRREK